MIRFIKLISQFGLNRLLYLSNYEKWIKNNIFQKNSLRNLDIDGDGIIDSFSFKIKNPLYSAYYKRPTIIVDEMKINPSKALIKKGNELIKMSEWIDENPLPLIPGESIEVIVLKEKGLKRGKHEIKILNARIVGFDTSMDLIFTDELRD